MRRSLVILVAVALSLLLMTGCGGSGADTRTTGSGGNGDLELESTGSDAVLEGFLDAWSVMDWEKMNTLTVPPWREMGRTPEDMKTMYEDRYPKIQATSLEWDLINKRQRSDTAYLYRVKVTYNDGGPIKNDEVQVTIMCCDPETGFSDPSGEWYVYPVVRPEANPFPVEEPDSEF